MRRRWWMSVTVVLVLLAGAVAWSAQPRAVVVDDVTFLVSGVRILGQSHDDVGHVGTLALAGEGCLVFEQAETAFLPLWPRGTAVERLDAGPAVGIDGHWFFVGDDVLVGRSRSSARVPDGCPDLPVFAIIDPRPVD